MGFIRNNWLKVIPCLVVSILVFAIGTVALAQTNTFPSTLASISPPGQVIPGLLPNQQVPLTELKAELANDPLSVGYASMTHFQAAQALNTVGLTEETVNVEFIQANDLHKAVVGVEYILLTAPERDLWAALLTIEQVPVANANIRGQVLLIWGPLSTTRANLIALQTRPASRAEALWGDGAFVTDRDIEEARLLP